jgi:hypothetical protein
MIFKNIINVSFRGQIICFLSARTLLKPEKVKKLRNVDLVGIGLFWRNPAIKVLYNVLIFIVGFDFANSLIFRACSFEIMDFANLVLGGRLAWILFLE